MKQKSTLSVIYRIFVILTFIAGVAMILKFAGVYSIVNDNNDMNEEALNKIGTVGYIQMSYYIMSFICFIGSIIVFKSTKTVASVFRTIFMGITALINVLAMRVAMVFASCYGKWDASDSQREKISDTIEDIEESEFIFTALTFFFVIAFLVFAITSIIYLCKKPNEIPAEQNSPEIQ